LSCLEKGLRVEVKVKVRVRVMVRVRVKGWKTGLWEGVGALPILVRPFVVQLRAQRSKRGRRTEEQDTKSHHAELKVR
jgi:hypothetical protein